MAGNSRSGRRRTPTAQLKLHGSYREDRHGGDEPTPTGKPTRPRQWRVRRVARKCWDRLVPALVELGLATDLDETALIEMCLWFEHYRTAFDAGQINDALKSWRAFDSIAGRFGYTPADRAKLRTTVSERKDDVEQYLA